MQASECADHDDSGGDTVPKTLETDVLVDTADLIAQGGVAALLVDD